MEQASASPCLLHLQGVSVRFGCVTALREVDLRVHAGERLVLLGANGSGKTTLLRVLHGLLPCSNGVRRVGGAAAAALPEPALPARPAARAGGLAAAMVFQRPFLLNLSVRFNVELGLWLRRVPAAERRRRSSEALRRVGLEAMAERSARALSGGQQQRLALARAWVLQPAVIFLDEPTASLDPSAKREVEALVQGFADSGVTVVMSTHNLGQAKRLGTRVAYLEAGRLVVDLPVERFFSEALPTEAAQFLKGELPWA
jgi:tungstate transport system ATP-binding protein